MSTLKIGRGFGLPPDLVTQTVAILAKRRAGKSYAARRIVEEIHGLGLQVVVLDPKGDHWGIRSSANGKSPGLPLVLLGGERGDVPLEPGSGDVVARLVVEERVSALLDLSLMRKGEVAAFGAHFLEQLYRLKAREKYRTPLMLVIDEADAIAPQRPQKGQERMLGAAEDIVRRGGQRGIGCLLVSQRSAVLNKNVLTQAEVLIALRTIAPQDLAALDAWIDVHGTQEGRRELMASLPSLPVGDAWVWSPGWPTAEGIFRRIHVSKIRTYDSGATPKVGEKRIEPRSVAEVDLNALRRQMAETVEKAKAKDPKALKKRVVELERELRAAAAAPAETVERVVEVPALTAEERSLLESTAGAVERLLTEIGCLEGVAKVLSSDLDAVLKRQAHARVPQATRPLAAAVTAAPRPRPVVRASQNGHEKLPKGQRAVLLALAQSGGGATGSKAALLAGYSAKSSTMRNIASALRQAGYAEGSITGQLQITPDGVDALGSWEPLPTGEALRQHWLDKMGSGAPAAVLRALIDAYPRSLSRAEIEAASGYSADSSTLRNALSKLNTLGLITGRGDERCASEDLFE